MKSPSNEIKNGIKESTAYSVITMHEFRYLQQLNFDKIPSFDYTYYRDYGKLEQSHELVLKK